MSNIEKYCNNSCNVPNKTNTNSSTNIIQNNTRNKYAEYIRNHMKSNVNNSVSGSSTSSIKITNFKPCDAGIIGKPVILYIEILLLILKLEVNLLTLVHLQNQQVLLEIYKYILL